MDNGGDSQEREAVRGCLSFAARIACHFIPIISMQGSFDCVAASLREAATPLKMTGLSGDGRAWSESVGISARLFILTFV